ncbi:MAG: metal-dependent transcriptional regulator [Euryarchaeota archaeon]|nr:metal-dependent transcriptional regulator [Euryarchaeota archaeon]
MISESMEEYLEALWVFLKEEGKDYAKINEIAERLEIAPPSAVEMLRKMEKLGLVEYSPRVGIRLTPRGEELARQAIRSHRLAELLLTELLDMELNSEVHAHACALEHHISKAIAEAVCIKLGHPRQCPHGKPIPRGECCSR